MPQPRRERAGSGGAVASPSPRVTLRLGAAGPWLTLFVLALGLALATRRAEIMVTVDLGGQRRVVEAWAGTVGDFLAEAALPVQAADYVSPPPGKRLQPGDGVRVLPARSVSIQVDGQLVHLRSQASTIWGVLQEAGIELGEADRVRLNGRFWPADQPVRTSGARFALVPEGIQRQAPVPSAAVFEPTTGTVRPFQSPFMVGLPDAGGPPWLGLPGDGDVWSIEVFRAVPVTIVEGDVKTERLLAGSSVGEALTAAGVPVYPGDELLPSAEAPLAGGMQITIARGTPFEISDGGRTQKVRAWATTVGEALTATGLKLSGADYTIPAADSQLVANMRVEIVRVAEDVLVQEVAIPFRRLTEPDPTLDLDEQRVLRPGQPGLMEQRLRVRYENGREVSRQVEEERILRAPVDERIAYGTRIRWQTVDTPEGPKRYWRKLRVYATSYSASRAGTPRSAPWYGRTRMGLPARRGIIAVDRRIIPLGTWVYVPGYGVALAGDTGGGIRRYHIDLCFDDDAYESWHQYVDLYLLEPLPPAEDMPWILP